MIFEPTSLVNRYCVYLNRCNLRFVGRYLLLMSCVLRSTNIVVILFNSAPLCSPRDTCSLLAPGCLESTIGCSYTRLNAPKVPRNNNIHTSLH